MSPEVTIDTARPEDRALVVPLILKQFEEHSITADQDALGEAVAAALSDEKLGVFLLARRRGRAVGVAYVSFVWSLEHCGLSAWLEELYVIPEERNRGVGRALLDTACRVSRLRGCAVMDLEIEEHLSRAENLYRREGFSPLSRTRWVRKFFC